MTRVAALSDCGIAQVIPLLRVQHLGDRRFDYLIPDDLAERVHAGSVVKVQFGSRSARAVVMGIVAKASEGLGELRPIEAVENLALAPDMTALAERLAEHYLSPLESCLRLVAPPLGRAGGGEVASARDWVYRAASETHVTPEEAGAAGGPAGFSGDGSRPLTQKQQVLLEAIPAGGVSIKAACEAAAVGKTVLQGLVKRDLVRLGAAPDETDAGLAGGGPGGGVRGLVLSGEQREAVDRLMRDYESRGLVERQLWGVTGSGKTEVYLHLTARALNEGAGAILLVPEIALTPLMIGRVRERFGGQVGVIHSGLTPTQRSREYARISRGEARVVVGARSAVFAPVAGLRLVIIDESHDGSYKQEEAPGYHAKTVARLRLADRGGLLLRVVLRPQSNP